MPARKTKRLRRFDLVQLNPASVRNKAFAGCVMTVTEPRDWGAQGYVQGLGLTMEHEGGQYYYRATWDEMSDPLGKARWYNG